MPAAPLEPGDEGWMQAAIAAARRGIAAGQTPFGTVIVSAGQVVAAGHNQVWASTDPTAHAEVTVIRMACQARSSITLAGCTLYSSCEPCPMCMAAIHWARLDRVVYGAAIADAAAAGFHELHLPAAELLTRGGSPVLWTPGCLAAECRQLFAAWQSTATARRY
ncbi:MAG TPA: nucleoside deaminase [Terriglobales bacterium]|nr:nucleoside deaminase [Terriglobales bacterium]